jgi:hypothetical protein
MSMNFEEFALRVTWSNDLEGNKELFAALENANSILGEELGRSKEFVTADWKLARDSRNRTLVELTLTDQFTRSEVIEKFDADEFRNETHLEKRLHRLWGHLLQRRSDGQLKRLEELVSQQVG